MSKPPVGIETKVGVSFLFELMSLHPSELHRDLRKLSPSDIAGLVERVEHLYPLLPDEGYGESVRRQMTFFMCLASPEHAIADNAVAILKRSKETPERDFLAFLGPARATALLLALFENHDASQSTFAATVLDAIRRHYPDALTSLPPQLLQKWQKSRNSILSLSSRAANLQLGLMEEEDFQRMLLRVLKVDKKGMATQWFAANPEFLESIPIEKLPSRVLTSILEVLAKQEPTRLIQFIRSSFSAGTQISHSNLWDASVQALERVGGSLADELFVDLIVRNLESSVGAEQHNLTREPALSLLSRNIWTIADRIRDERLWKVVFDAVSSKIPKGPISDWIKTASPMQAALKGWILESYVPRLLERRLLPASFVAELTDTPSQASTINALCARVLSHIRSLQTIAADWPKTRDAEKQRLANVASVGLRIAIRTAQNNESLEGRLTNLLTCVERWRSSESPAVDPSVASVAGIIAPENRPANIELVNAFFSSRLTTPHEICLFFGANPWAVNLFLASPESSWPKLEVVVEQIIKSLVFFADLSERAIKSLQELQNNIRIDFGIALRDGLDEVEEMMAGYFAFRSVLRRAGLDQAERVLGELLSEENISSDKHKVLRDSMQAGRLRIFSLGLKVGDRVVGSSKVMKSGDTDDRD